MLDIPNTMLASIQTAAPRIKALTFFNTDWDDRIRAACREKGIIVVWANPPDFVRKLD